MLNYNKFVGVGNLTKDPETTTTKSGTKIATMRIAMNHTYKDNEHNKQEDVCYVDVKAFGARADTVEKYCKKGRSILVEGRLAFDSWEDKEGNKRSKHYIVLDQLGFNDAPSNGNGKGTVVTQPAATTEVVANTSDFDELG